MCRELQRLRSIDSKKNKVRICNHVSTTISLVGSSFVLTSLPSQEIWILRSLLSTSFFEIRRHTGSRQYAVRALPSSLSTSPSPMSLLSCLRDLAHATGHVPFIGVIMYERYCSIDGTTTSTILSQKNRNTRKRWIYSMCSSDHILPSAGHRIEPDIIQQFVISLDRFWLHVK